MLLCCKWQNKFRRNLWENMVVKDTLIINYMLLISEMRIFLFFNARTIQIVLHMLTLSFIENLFKKNWNMMKMKIVRNLDNCARCIFLVMSLLWWLRVLFRCRIVSYFFAEKQIFMSWLFPMHYFWSIFLHAL